MPAFFSLLHANATAGETRFCRGSSALCSSADTMTDETSHSDNCRLNLGLNDFSHERTPLPMHVRRIRKTKRAKIVTSVQEELREILLTHIIYIIYILNKSYETNIINTLK